MGEEGRGRWLPVCLSIYLSAEMSWDELCLLPTGSESSCLSAFVCSPAGTLPKSASASTEADAARVVGTTVAGRAS